MSGKQLSFAGLVLTLAGTLLLNMISAAPAMAGQDCKVTFYNEAGESLNCQQWTTTYNNGNKWIVIRTDPVVPLIKNFNGSLSFVADPKCAKLSAAAQVCMGSKGGAYVGVNCKACCNAKIGIKYDASGKLMMYEK